MDNSKGNNWKLTLEWSVKPGNVSFSVFDKKCCALTQQNILEKVNNSFLIKEKQGKSDALYTFHNQGKLFKKYKSLFTVHLVFQFTL